MKLSLGAAHEIGFSIAMTASVAIVLLGGELPLFAWLVCVAPWVSFLLAHKRIAPPALSATLVGLAGIALGVVTLVRGGVESSVLAGTEVLMGLVDSWPRDIRSFVAARATEAARADRLAAEK